MLASSDATAPPTVRRTRHAALRLLLVIAATIALTASCTSTDSTSEPTETSEPTSTPEPTATSEPTTTPEPTSTPEPTATPEPTTTPEPTATPEPTSTPEPTATPEPTSTPEPTATSEPTSTPEPTATSEPTTTPDRAIEFDFSFETDSEGWTAGFADLPVDYNQSIYELGSEHRALPSGLEGSGIYIQGHNRSDDLFMFLKRQIDGLQPSTTYAVSASINLATNVPLGSIGIGGSPGSSVFVKAGASTVEPLAALSTDNHLRINIDKGNQSTSGSAMAVIGDVANPDVVADEYRTKALTSGPQFLSVEADNSGQAWLIVGTDSGFEGLTRLYYDQIFFTLTPTNSP